MLSYLKSKKGIVTISISGLCLTTILILIFIILGNTEMNNCSGEIMCGFDATIFLVDAIGVLWITILYACIAGYALRKRNKSK